MTKYVRKILLRNSKRLLRKLQKILGGYFFAAPCIGLLAACRPLRPYHFLQRMICGWLQL